jgi:hypothetical protein
MMARLPLRQTIYHVDFAGLAANSANLANFAGGGLLQVAKPRQHRYYRIANA